MIKTADSSLSWVDKPAVRWATASASLAGGTAMVAATKLPNTTSGLAKGLFIAGAAAVCVAAPLLIMSFLHPEKWDQAMQPGNAGSRDANEGSDFSHLDNERRLSNNQQALCAFANSDPALCPNPIGIQYQQDYRNASSSDQSKLDRLDQLGL